MEGERKAADDNSLIENLNNLVQEGDATTITGMIEDMQDNLALLESHGGAPVAIAAIKARIQLAETARERVWMQRMSS